MLRLALALFAVQAGFHGFTAALPLALAKAGVPDPEIGLVVGSAAVIQVPAAFVAGAFLDRFGGARLLVVAAIAYIVAAGVLLVPGVEPSGPRLPFVVARTLQGIGIAIALPASLSMVPGLVPPERRGFGLAFIGAAHNLTLVALPPLSLAILAAAGLDAVAIATILFAVFGVAVARTVPAGSAPESRGMVVGERTLRPAARRLGFAFRRSWAPLLGIILLYVAHWGAIVAYLPQRADAAGADIGLFFAADGLAILLARVPTGWLADRIRGRWLVIGGILMSAVAIAMLLVAPTTPLLIVSGILGGAGGGFVLTPILVELSRRSDDADRGSAFALFSAALAGALALGSIGAAPIVGTLGFEGAIVGGLLAMGGAMILSFADRPLGRAPAPAAASS